MEIELEAGSFRDKANRVFYRDGKVFRALSQAALENWEKLRAAPFFDALRRAGDVIDTQTAFPNALPKRLENTWAGAVEHERVPFISYPYEWSFSMLQDAAVLQLRLLERALEHGFTLKDASSYNIQWKGVHPLFIDIPSFIPRHEGEPWTGYKQFCELFLNPLLLQAHRNIPFQPWLRGSIDGISSEETSQLLGRDFHKKGVLFDVLLHAFMQRRTGHSSKKVRSSLNRAGFSAEMILSNVRRLGKIVRGLRCTPRHSHWSTYAHHNRYSSEDYEKKLLFVRRVISKRRYPMVWDLGCNTGDFSKAVAESADWVISVDRDWQVIDQLYGSLKHSGPKNILPLVMSLSDMSSGIGWRGEERKSFVTRGQPGLILCLALIHHVCITAKIPINEWIGWLAQQGADVIIEFVRPEDPMAQVLLEGAEGNHDDYDPDVFEAILKESFHIDHQEDVASGLRTLYACHVKK